jgi:RecA/RadA recombinase
MTIFVKAIRSRIPLKIGITGPSGSGKTYSALQLATGLANGGKIAALDTENRSSSLYATTFNFDVLNISSPFTDVKFVDGLNQAVAEGYAVVIVDSLSHAWLWTLDYKAGLDSRGGNTYTNWGPAGKKINSVLDAILRSPVHVICCLRSKTDYILEINEKGKLSPRKVGLAPVFREGVEFEFSTVLDIGPDHCATTSKDRTGLFVDEHFQVRAETGRKLLDWLNSAPDQSLEPVAQPASLTVQEQLADAIKDVDPEVVKLFLIQRKASTGSILEVSDEYAEKALLHTDKFRETLAKFAKEPF